LEENYKDGKKYGLWTYWDEEGNVTKTETYKDGELVE
jgi:antitoxin component YwqK of YwqJK toxin-antitoxin module